MAIFQLRVGIHLADLPAVDVLVAAEALRDHVRVYVVAHEMRWGGHVQGGLGCFGFAAVAAAEVPEGGYGEEEGEAA